MNARIPTAARCLLTVMLGLFAATVPVQEAAGANVYAVDALDQVTGNPGETVQFTARVLLTQSQGNVEGYAVGLTVSPAVCAIVDVTPGAAASGAELFVSDILTPPNSATAGAVIDFYPPYAGQTIPGVWPGDSPQELLKGTVAAPVPLRRQLSDVYAGVQGWARQPSH